MARRKQKDLVDPGTMIGLAVTLVVGMLVVQNLQRIGVVILICGAAALAYPVLLHLRRSNARRSLLDKAQTIAGNNMRPLVIKRAQLVWTDEYGKPQTAKWEKEIDNFIEQHIAPSLTPNEYRALQREPSSIADLIRACVEAASQNQPALHEFSNDMTPAAFEVFCAEELRRAGWNARVTRTGRDQGVDVVAELGVLRVVIQCKLYTRPVGNKAVQEAAAARAHEQATHGIVATNNRYTRDAKELAATNGILLVHYSELRNLHDLLVKGPRYPAMPIQPSSTSLP